MTRRRAAAGALAVLAALGCRAGADDAAVHGAALRALFRERERAAGVVVWADPGEPGPVFVALGVRGVAPDGASARELAAAAGLAVARATADDMERLFARHPDGWAAFYARHPRSAGLVELGTVRRAGDSAVVTVGRACGEQCRNAWRVTLRTGAGVEGWRAERVDVLRVPR